MSSEVFTPLQVLHGTTDEKLNQIRSFLFQLTDQLNRAVHAVETNTIEVVQKRSGKIEADAQETIQNISNLKALITANVEEIESHFSEIETVLTGYESLVSDYGTFTSEYNTTLTMTARALEMNSSVSEVISGISSYTGDLNGLIRVGWLNSENGEWGIAIGKDCTYDTDTQVVTTAGFSSVFTATELAFYQNDAKVAYLSNSALYITDAVVTGTLSIGSDWQIFNNSAGFVIRYVG